MTIAVIVDMQAYFKASNKVIAEVVEFAKKAIINRSPIVILEMDYNGLTHQEIVDVCSQSKKYVKVFKDINDGSHQVEEFVKTQNLQKYADTFRVCGVYSNCCVKDTAVGLAKRFSDSRIIVHHEASCGTSEAIQDSLNHNDWYWFKKMEISNNLAISKRGRLLKRAG